MKPAARPDEDLDLKPAPLFSSAAAVQAWVDRHGVFALLWEVVCGRVRGPSLGAVRTWRRTRSTRRPIVQQVWRRR